MSTIELSPVRLEVDPVVAAATAGDESAFAQLVHRHRRELQAHVYSMMRSHEDSEDLTQETFLRAWRMRESYRGSASFRAWLFRIATNTSLSTLERRSHFRRLQGPASVELRFNLAEEPAASDPAPDTILVSKETTERALLVAIQHIPPAQRAVLTLRDVLGFSAKDTAELLGRSVVSVNSSLQRARATLRRHLLEHEHEWSPRSDPSPGERALLRRYLDAVENARADTFVTTS